MSNQDVNHPFQSLGNRLKQLREKQLESLAEVSGSIEVDVSELSDFENGIKRPNEDILALLISHFSAKAKEATLLWKLAGYDDLETPITGMIGDDLPQANSTVLVMPMDARIVYTDMVHVMVNNYGVVMNFMQGAGPGNQPLAIARIGMSKEHAKSVLEVLQQTLDQAEKTAEPKALPQSKKLDQK